MNGTIPATVNSRDGSGETSDALGTTVCPRCAKCSRNRRRISAVCMYLLGSAGPGRERVGSAAPAGGQGSAVSGGMCAVPAGQPDVIACRERCVQAGARSQLGLPVGRGRADLGAELTDGVGQVSEGVGDRPADAAGGEL